MTDATKQPDPQPSPPADPARGGRTLADALRAAIEAVQPRLRVDAGTTEDERSYFHSGFDQAKTKCLAAVESVASAQQAPPLAADGAGRGERRWAVGVAVRDGTRKVCAGTYAEKWQAQAEHLGPYAHLSGAEMNDGAGATVGPPLAADGAGRWGVLRDGRLCAELFTDQGEAAWLARKLENGATVVPVLVTVLAPDAGAAGTNAHDVANDLHQRAMNVPVNGQSFEAATNCGKIPGIIYKLGHRDARHDIAEMIVGHEGLRQLGERIAATEARALDLGTVCVNQALEVEAMRHERDKLTVALQWYADAGNWEHDGHPSHSYVSKAVRDYGERARAALAGGGTTGEDGR